MGNYLTKIIDFDYTPMTMHLSAPLIQLLCLVLAILVLSFLIDFFLSNSFLGQSYRIFVAPGVIVHELAHAFFCLITGAQLKKISFFEKDGGRVEHFHSKLPVIGPILISLSPLLIGSVLIYFLARRLGGEGLDLTTFDISKQGIVEFFRTVAANINLGNIKTIIIVYLVLSIAVTMTPSFQDLKNSFLSLLILGIGIFFADRWKILDLSSQNIPSYIFILLSTVLFLLILSALLSIIIFGISRIIKPR